MFGGERVAVLVGVRVGRAAGESLSGLIPRNGLEGIKNCLKNIEFNQRQ